MSDVEKILTINQERRRFAEEVDAGIQPQKKPAGPKKHSRADRRKEPAGTEKRSRAERWLDFWMEFCFSILMSGAGAGIAVTVIACITYPNVPTILFGVVNVSLIVVCALGLCWLLEDLFGD